MFNVIMINTLVSGLLYWLQIVNWLVGLGNYNIIRQIASLLRFKEGKTMKNTLVSMILGIILCMLVALTVGCSQPGETEAEGRRRHIRNARINQQSMTEDIDKAMLYDKPSRLTDKRIP